MGFNYTGGILAGGGKAVSERQLLFLVSGAFGLSPSPPPPPPSPPPPLSSPPLIFLMPMVSSRI